jgi:hypothetical protein
VSGRLTLERGVYTRRGATCGVTKDVETTHDAVGRCTTGRGAKPGGILRASA